MKILMEKIDRTELKNCQNVLEAGDDFIEFDSMVNIRPRQGNRSRYVENSETREKIKEVVAKWIK